MRIGLIIGGFLLGLVALVAVVPRLIDWTEQRQWIEAGLSAALNETVRINGSVDAVVLPAPALVAQDITIGGPDQAVQATIGALETRLRLGPLFGGRLEIERLVVRDAILETREAAEAEQMPTAETDAPAGETRRLTLDDVELINFVWNVDGETLIFPQAALSARSLSGPFAAQGVITWQGADVSFEMGMERLRPTRPTGLTVGLTWPDGAEAHFNGSANHEQSPWQFTGALAGQSGSPLSWFSALDLSYPSAFKADLDARLNARVVGNFSSLAFEDIRLALGRSRLTGTAAFDWTGPFMAAEATLSFGQLDLDQLLAPQATNPGPSTAANQPSAGGESADGPVARGWSMRLSATADLVSWRGGVLSNARLRGLADAAGLSLETGSAQLPGATSLSGSGRVPWSSGAEWDLAFDGTTANARALASWAGLEQALGIFPAGRLNRAEVSGQLTGQGSDLRVELEQAQIDQTSLSGTIVPESADGDVVFDVSVPSLTLDMVMPERTPPGPASLRAVAAEPSADPSITPWRGQLQIGSLLYQGRKASGVSLALRNTEAGVHIDRAEIENLDGVALRAAEVPLRPNHLAALAQSQLEVTAPDLGVLLRLLNQPDPDWVPEGEVSVQLSASASEDGVAFAITGAAGAARLSGTVVAQGSEVSVETWQAQLSGAFDASDLSEGLSALGLGPRSEFQFQGKGTRARADIDALTLLGPSAQLDGSGWIKSGSSRMQFNGDVTLMPRAVEQPVEASSSSNAAPRLRRPRVTDAPIDLDWIKGLEGQLNVRVEQASLFGFPAATGTFTTVFDGAALTVSDVDLKVGTGLFTGEGRVRAENPGISASFQAQTLPLGEDRSLTLNFSGATQGASAKSWVTGMTGEGTYRVAADPTRNQRRMSLSAFMAPFDGLAAIGTFLARPQGPSTLDTDYMVAGGVIGFEDLRFSGPSYRGRFDGRFDLNAWDLDARGRVDLIGSTISRLLGQQVSLPGVLPIEVTGDPAEPRIKVDISGGLLPD